MNSRYFKFSFLTALGLTSLLTTSEALGRSFAYVSNFEDDNISIIDTELNEVVKTVGAGDQPEGLAIHPSGKFVYVPNFGSDTISVIDTSNHELTQTIPVGHHPISVAFSPDGTKAYVANAFPGNNGISDQVSIIDVQNHQLIASVNSGGLPQSIAVGRLGTRVYVTDSWGMGIRAIDVSTNQLIGNLPAPSADSLEVDMATDRLYFVSTDLVNGNLISLVHIFHIPPTVSAQNPAQMLFTTNIPNGAGALSISKSTGKVYVLSHDQGQNGVKITDLDGVLSPTFIPLSTQLLRGLAVDELHKQLYVLGISENKVFVVNLDDNSLIKTIDVGKGPTTRNRFVGPELCGNGRVESGIAGEQCDDGNLTDGDGCSALCQNETQNPVPNPNPNPTPPATPEICDQSGDEDQDGKTNCKDEDCLLSPLCTNGHQNPPPPGSTPENPSISSSNGGCSFQGIGFSNVSSHLWIMLIGFYGILRQRRGR